MDRNDVLAFADNLRSQMYENEEIVALNELVGAYEKIKPIKPIINLFLKEGHYFTDSHADVLCGECNTYIDEVYKGFNDMWYCTHHCYDYPYEAYVYCPYCGQKIDWSILNEV